MLKKWNEKKKKKKERIRNVEIEIHFLNFLLSSLFFLV